MEIIQNWVLGEDARRRLTNLTNRVTDAEQLDLEDNAFDAVICRNGLMFVPHLQQALGEIRRVLKLGRNLAALVWSAPERNPLSSLPLTIVAKYTGISFFGTPGPFALADPAAFGQALTEAGWRSIVIQAIAIRFHFASVEAFIQAGSLCTPWSTAGSWCLGISVTWAVAGWILWRGHADIRVVRVSSPMGKT